MTISAFSQLGPYQVQDRLGAGGMGEVFRAKDLRLGRDVAIKVLLPSIASDPDRLRRFEQEARTIAGLNHPNLLQIFDTGVQDGSPFMVMELLEGQTLRARLGGKPLPLRKVVDYALQIAQGLSAAHSKGIIHRDLKPENIFLTRDDRVKLLDFGLAKLQAPMMLDSDITLADATAPLATRMGTMVGTVGYMSPEQVGGRVVDPRSDLFSLGIVLWEMVTGQRPFTGESAVETLHAILKDDPKEFPSALQVPPHLQRLIHRCLEKDPVNRFQTAQDLAFDLQGLDLSLSSRVGAKALVLPRPSGRWVRRGLGALGAVGLLAMAFLAGRGLHQPSVPTLQRLTYHHDVIGEARFAPDGRSFVFSMGAPGEPGQLWLGRMEAVGAHPLGFPKGARLMGVSSQGEVALLLPASDGSTTLLCRAPLTGGAPREVAEGVLAADWLPDGRDLAVLRQTEKGKRLEFPIGRPIYDVPSMALVERIKVSPRGDRVAFVEHAGLQKGAIVTMDRAGKRQVLLEAKADTLLWAPRGDELLAVVRPTADRQEVRAITLGGKSRLVHCVQGRMQLLDMSGTGQVLVGHSLGRLEMVALQEGKEQDLSWLQSSMVADVARDGRGVLFAETQEGSGPGGIYYRRLKDAEAIRLGDGDPLTLSPDGRWAVAKIIGQPSDLLLVPTGPGESRRLSTQGVRADWVCFAGADQLVLGGARAEDPTFHLFVLPLNGGPMRQLPPSPPREAYAVVSPDGTRLAVGPLEDGSVVLVTLADGRERRVKGFPEAEAPIQWLQDGETLVSADLRRLPARLSRFDLRTGSRKPWLDLNPQRRSDATRLRNLSVTPDGKTLAYTFERVLNTDLYVMEGWQ